MKRFLDVFFSLLFLIILSPLLLIVSLIILLSDGRPVSFKQERIGYKGKRFFIYKFRTMQIGTREASTAELTEASEVITKTGKFLRKSSIDELPQLINVLKGEMSFIGPRPLIPSEEIIHKMRMEYNVYSVRPGITGLAQVNGRDNISDEQKALYDKEYVEGKSLKMDIKILAMTVLNVVKGKDVNDK